MKRFRLRRLLVCALALLGSSRLPAQQAEDRVEESVLVPIVRVLPGEGKVREVVLAYGEEDGVVLDWRGTLYSTNRKEAERKYEEIGRGQVVALREREARARVTLDDPDGKGVVQGDLVELTLRVPRVQEHTILWALAKLQVTLTDLARDVTFTDYRTLALEDSQARLDASLDAMRADIAEAAEFTQELTPPTAGRFRGRAFPDIMTNASREEVLDFLRFIESYPGKYIGRDWKISEVFATWVLNNAFGSATEVAARLDAMPGDEERASYLRELAATEESRTLYSLEDFANNWYSRAQSEAADGRAARGLVLAGYAVEAAKLVGQQDLVAWSHFSRGYALSRLGRPEESRAAYEESLALFRGIDPPTEDSWKGVNYCLTNIANVDRSRGSYAQALDALRDAEEVEKRFPIGDRSRAITQNNVGQVLASLARYEEAIAAYDRAAALYEGADDTDGAQSMALAIAGIHAKLGRNAEAAASYARCAEVCHRMGLRRGEADAWDKLGTHHRTLGDLRPALEAFGKALELRRAIEDRRAEAETLAHLAELHGDLGEHEAAIRDHEEALRARRVLRDSAGEADSLKKLGELCKEAGDPRRALGYYEQAEDVTRRSGDRERAVAILEARMGVQWDLFEYAEAVSTCDRLIELHGNSDAKDDLAWALRCRGALRGNLGDFAGALPDLERALALRRETKFAWGQADTLLVLGMNCAMWTKWGEARARVQEALDLATGAGDRALEVRCRRQMGQHFAGEYLLPEARKWLDEALALARHPDFSSPSEVAVTLNAYGSTLLLQGEFKLARARYAEALPLAEGANARGAAIDALQGIAEAASYEGNLAEARELYDRALKVAGAVGNDWGRASLHQGLANLLTRLGEGAAGFREHDEALALWTSLKNTWGKAAVRSNRASDRITFGDFDGALEDLDIAESLARSIGEKQILAAIRFSRGEARLARGETAPAIVEYDTALALSREIGHRRFVTGALHRLAEAHRTAGEALAEAGKAEEAEAEFVKAQGSADEGLRLARDAGARVSEGEALYQVAAIALARGHVEGARGQVAEAARLLEGSGAADAIWQMRYLRSRIEERAGNLVAARTERGAAIDILQGLRASLGGSAVSEEGFLKSKVKVYESMVSLLGKLITAEPPGEGRLRLVEEAQGFVARARFEVLSRDTSALTANSGALDAYRRLQSEIARLEKEQKEALGAGNSEKAERVTRLIADKDKDLTRELMRLSAADPDMQARLKFDPRVTARAVRAAPAGARLLVYFVGESKLFVWIYDRTGFLEWKEHGIGRRELSEKLKRAGDLLQEMVERVGRREAMGRGFGPAAEEAESNPAWYRENVKSLRAVLSDLYGNLVAPVAGHVDSADPLLILPYGQLNYLPFEALIGPDGAFLGAKKRIAYFTTERNMERTFGRLAAPLTPHDPLWVGFADPRGKLVDSMEEANEIEALFPRHEVYTRETGNATEGQLGKMPADCTVLHFATHGYLNSREPGASFLELAEERGAAEAGDDGKLEACEVLDRFEATPCVANGRLRLVVLAACDTARAQDSPQAELLGMPNEFTLAGAPAVVASLWSVYSYTTTDLMIDFYRGMLERKLDLAAALREARVELLTKKDGRYAHPFYWAPFLLFGDWR